MKNLLPESVTNDTAFRAQSREIITENFGLTDEADIDVFENIGGSIISLLAQSPEVFPREMAEAFMETLEDNFVGVFDGSIATHPSMTPEKLQEHFGLSDKEAPIVHKISDALGRAASLGVIAKTVNPEQFEVLSKGLHVILHDAFGGHSEGE